MSNIIDLADARERMQGKGSEVPGDPKAPDTILIVDGHGLTHRAFHAVPTLNAPDGAPTNARLGFMNMLQLAEEKVSPRCVAVAFDAHGPTFRHELLPQYKANRKPSPDDLRAQFPPLQELLRLMGCSVLIEPGVEADDVIGSLALRAAAAGYRAVILSSDKDLQQVRGEGVEMLRPVKAGVSAAELFDAAAFEAKWGFPPSSVPDYLALLGDSSDNVPGVPGVGEKGATQLIAQWRTLEGLFDSLSDVKPATRKKLEAAGLESAVRSRGLIRLKLDVPVDLDACLTAAPDFAGAIELAMRLGLSKLVRRLTEARLRAGTDAPAAVQVEDRQVEDRIKARAVPFHELEEQAARKEMAVVLLDGAGAENAPAGCFRVALPTGEYADCDREALISLIGRARAERVLVKDYKALLARDPELLESAPSIWDLRTACYLLHPDASAETFPELVPEGAEPATALFALRRELDPEIDRHEGLRGVMEGIDLPLLPVLDRMERWGVRLDPVRFAALQEELGAQIARIESGVAGLTGETVNLNSPRQVAELLFQRLGFTPEKKTKGRTSWSTSSSVLEGLAALPNGQVPRLLLEHRELSKMLNGFVVPLQRAAQEGGGVVHTTFEPAVTGTGRLSSRDPNLQNIPAFGQWADRIKEGLIPVREGNVFVAADYSQIELRVLAHMSGEPRLIEAFQEGRDIHAETASWVFHVAPEFVTPELRRTAKMINFGLLYGMSPYGLAERLGMSRTEARKVLDRYFDALPGVRDFLKGIVAQAQASGYARTVEGRIRPVAEVKLEGAGRDGLTRALLNAPIQGTAADIARRAMVNFDRAFAGDGEVRLFLQVHDSLVCECPVTRAEDVGRALREIMTGAATLSLPLEVELKTGGSLAEV